MGALGERRASLQKKGESVLAVVGSCAALAGDMQRDWVAQPLWGDGRVCTPAPTSGGRRGMSVDPF